MKNPERVSMVKKNKKLLSGLLRGIVIAVAGVLLGINVYFLNAESLVGNGMPMPFGVGASIVLSGSMEPTLHVDDLIFVKKAETFTVGDIVVYQSHGSSVVHRIMSLDGETVTTKGDANNTEDDPITVSDIKGIYVGKIGGVGGFVRFMKSPVGTILILAAALILLELSFRKEKESGDRELDEIKEEIRRLQAEQQNKEQ